MALSLDGCGPVFTTFGNHDPLELLARLHNRDGRAVLLARESEWKRTGLKLAAIGGIWAKSHAKAALCHRRRRRRMPRRIAQAGPVDILITHGCPIGLADLTPSGRHGGQRCFLDAFKSVSPRLHLCGHLHVAQERILKDGSKVINVGPTPAGSCCRRLRRGRGTIDARLEQVPVR